MFRRSKTSKIKIRAGLSRAWLGHVDPFGPTKIVPLKSQGDSYDSDTATAIAQDLRNKGDIHCTVVPDRDES